MANDTWFKFHTSIVTSAKFLSLPDNDHRWAFTALMICCKKNIIGENSGVVPNGLPIVLAIAGMNERKFRRVSNCLLNCGLIKDNLWVIGFNDSQLSKSAVRMRRHRGRHSDVQCDGQSDGRSRSRSREEETPLSPPAGGSRSRGPTKDQLAEVIGHLRQATGRSFGLERGNKEIIRAFKQDGATVEDCKAVIDYAKRTWSPQYVNKVSPFRAKNFSVLLDEAQAGPARGGTPSAGGDGGVFRY